MEWRDEGLVIGVRRHGETGALLELFTPSHGRHLGLVPRGRSRRLRPLLQPGNGVLATWRARLDEHVGTYAVEPLRMRAAETMESALALHALNALCALVRLLPERDPHPGLYDDLGGMADRLADRALMPALMVRFELNLLAELGFGLDLACCAVTGQDHDLAYVSPKSGRAVTRAVGAPWRDRLLDLPLFLGEGGQGDRPITAEAVRAGFRLTGHFLGRDVFAPRGLGLPEARRAYLAALFPS